MKEALVRLQVTISLSFLQGTRVTEAVYITVPKKPLYISPPQPAVFNWTFWNNITQYRMNFYRYLGPPYNTWDQIFWMVNWLHLSGFLNDAGRMKFFPQPQNTIVYILTKPSDVGKYKHELIFVDGVNWRTVSEITDVAILTGKNLLYFFHLLCYVFRLNTFS